MQRVSALFLGTCNNFSRTIHIFTNSSHSHELITHSQISIITHSLNPHELLTIWPTRHIFTNSTSTNSSHSHELLTHAQISIFTHYLHPHELLTIWPTRHIFTNSTSTNSSHIHQTPGSCTTHIVTNPSHPYKLRTLPPTPHTLHFHALLTLTRTPHTLTNCALFHQLLTSSQNSMFTHYSYCYEPPAPSWTARTVTNFSHLHKLHFHAPLTLSRTACARWWLIDKAESGGLLIGARAFSGLTSLVAKVPKKAVHSHKRALHSHQRATYFR